MVNLPTPGLHEGEWGDLLNEYLTEEHHSDGTHDTKKILGVPPTAGQVPVSDPAAPRGFQWQPVRFSVTVPLQNPKAGPIVAWRAPAKARIVAIYGYRQGGMGVTINARRQGGEKHLATDLPLSVTHSWLDGGIVQDAMYEAGDTLLVIIVALAGMPEQVTIQIDLEYR